MGSGLGGAGQTEPEKPSTEQTGELSGGPTQRELLQLVAILTSHCLAGLSGAGRGCCAGNIQSQEQSVAQRHQTWAKDSKEWRCSLRLRTARVSQGLYLYMELSGWLSGKEPAYQCRRRGFEPWVGKIPWRRKWESSPIFLPGKSQGQRSLAGYSPWGCRVRHDGARLSITYYLFMGAFRTRQRDVTGQEDRERLQGRWSTN